MHMHTCISKICLRNRRALSLKQIYTPKTGLSLPRSLVHRQTWRRKVAVHWVRVNALSAELSPKLTWDAMGLRADSARWLSVRAEPLTRWGRAESARNPIAANVKIGDDCANAQPGPSPSGRRPLLVYMLRPVCWLGQYAYYPGSKHTAQPSSQYADCPGSNHTARPVGKYDDCPGSMLTAQAVHNNPLFPHGPFADPGSKHTTRSVCWLMVCEIYNWCWVAMCGVGKRWPCKFDAPPTITSSREADERQITSSRRSRW